MLISLFIVLLKMKHIKQQPINKLCFCKWNRDMLITSKQLGCIQHGEFLNGNGTHLQKMRKTPWVWPHVSEYLLFYNCVLLWIRSIKVMVRIVQTNRLHSIAFQAQQKAQGSSLLKLEVTMSSSHNLKKGQGEPPVCSEKQKCYRKIRF